MTLESIHITAEARGIPYAIIEPTTLETQGVKHEITKYSVGISITGIEYWWTAENMTDKARFVHSYNPKTGKHSGKRPMLAGEQTSLW